MTARKKIITTVAAWCWWLVVLAVMYRIEKMFGGVLKCEAVKFALLSAALAITRILLGPPDEWSKPILPSPVMWVLDGIIVFSMSYVLLNGFFKDGKWELLLFIPEWFVFLLIFAMVLLYKKRYGHEPSTEQFLFFLGLMLLLGLSLTIHISGVRTVTAVQAVLEENGYSRTGYKGEQSYQLLKSLYGDAPKLQPAASSSEINTGLYLYSGWKDNVEYALLASPVTGRIIAELPLEAYPAYAEILHEDQKGVAYEN